MGIGGIARRPRLVGAWAILGAATLLGCRSAPSGEELRSSSDDAQVAPSLVVGHRFGRWLEVQPDPASQPALERACLLEQVGSAEEAIIVLGDALLDLGPNVALLEARGALYLSVGYPRAAAGDFQSASVLAPDDGRIAQALGHAYEELHLWRQALEALQRGHGAGVRGPEMLLSLARVHRALEHVGISAHFYQEVLSTSEARATEILAEALVLAGDDPERLRGVEEAHNRLETCLGAQDESWLLRQLLHESPGESEREIGAALHALELSPTRLSTAAQRILTALQLVDPATQAATSSALVQAAGNEAQRTALERCLTR